MVRITAEDRTITVVVLDRKRSRLIGMGTFVERLKKGEVSISKEALALLAKCPYRRGLQGIEFFGNKVIGYFGCQDTTVIPLDGVSVHDGAVKWLKEVAVIEEEDLSGTASLFAV